MLVVRFFPNHDFQLAVREYQRQARYVVNPDLQDACEGYEVMMMTEIQGLRNRYGEQTEADETRVAEVLVEEAVEALRGQRHHLLHEHQVIIQIGEREKEFMISQLRSEIRSQAEGFRRALQEREVQQKHTSGHMSQCFQSTLEHSEARLRVQF